jgi:hypothetical protein
VAELAAVRPPSPEETERLNAVAEEVRRASQEARLLPLAELAAGFAPEEPERLGELVRLPAEEGIRPADLALVSEAGVEYLYSETYMTRQYADTAALVASGDPGRLIAETVRFDSATYPRPTPMATFAYEPYGLTADEVARAVGQISQDPQYTDIQTTMASDGARYLYSKAHLVKELADSLAEWDAVGQFNSP